MYSYDYSDLSVSPIGVDGTVAEIVLKQIDAP